MIKTAFSFVAAPIAGSIVGGILMSVAVPAPAAFFCLMFTLFGAGVSIAITTVLGPLALYAINRLNLPPRPSLLLIALIASVLTLAVIQYATKSQIFPPVHTSIFAITTAIATVFIFLGINPQITHESCSI